MIALLKGKVPKQASQLSAELRVMLDAVRYQLVEEQRSVHAKLLEDTHRALALVQQMASEFDALVNRVADIERRLVVLEQCFERAAEDRHG